MAPANNKEDAVGGDARGAIVVTGASTGIGEACALHLEGLGYRVFAGVRSAAAGEALVRKSAGRLTPVQLDVTSAADIAAAADLVARECGGAGLSGLLNNAGITVNGPLEFLPLDDWRRQLEINVIGQVAVTQAFLPLLRAAKGRIVNIGSVSGRLAMLFGGPYSASKFALEAITDSLRMELKPWGIEVIIVEPGAIATPIWDKAFAAAEKLAGNAPATTVEMYGPAMDAMLRAAKKSAREAVPVHDVARVVEHAFTAAKPRTRYRVGRDAWKQILLSYLPGRLRDRLILAYLKGLKDL